MHPDTFFQIKELERRELLAHAERRRLIETAATAAGARPRSTATLRRLRHGLVGSFATVARVCSLRNAPVGDEAAALPSA